MSNSKLETQVLAAFLCAEAEGHRDAAEYLMRALEALCPCPEVVPAGSALSDAYHDVARQGPIASADHGDNRVSRRRFARKRLH